MPLNIDFQQILLHWMNLAILTWGLYVLLYKPVKQFMDKREAHYQELERQAADKLAQAQQIQRHAQFYWDYVMVENSEGAHNYKAAHANLDKAEAQLEEGFKLLGIA